MCMIDDAEPGDFDHYEQRRAAKEHRCTECGRTIHRGEQYEHFRGLMDGHWVTCRTCAHCLAAREWLRIVCNGWMFGFVAEELKDHWDEEWMLRSVGLGRLILGMGRRWRDGADPVPSYAADCARKTLAPT